MTPPVSVIRAANPGNPPILPSTSPTCYCCTTSSSNYIPTPVADGYGHVPSAETIYGVNPAPPTIPPTSPAVAISPYTPRANIPIQPVPMPEGRPNPLTIPGPDGRPIEVRPAWAEAMPDPSFANIDPGFYAIPDPSFANIDPGFYAIPDPSFANIDPGFYAIPNPSPILPRRGGHPIAPAQTLQRVTNNPAQQAPLTLWQQQNSFRQQLSNYLTRFVRSIPNPFLGMFMRNMFVWMGLINNNPNRNSPAYLADQRLSRLNNQNV